MHHLPLKWILFVFKNYTGARCRDAFLPLLFASDRCRIYGNNSRCRLINYLCVNYFLNSTSQIFLCQASIYPTVKRSSIYFSTWEWFEFMTQRLMHSDNISGDIYNDKQKQGTKERREKTCKADVTNPPRRFEIKISIYTSNNNAY